MSSPRRSYRPAVLLAAFLVALLVIGLPRAGAQSYRVQAIDTGSNTSFAFGINERGQVAGFGDRAFLWENGSLTYLGSLGGGSSSAYGINMQGQVVGTPRQAGPPVGAGLGHAFLWTSGVMTDLGASPGHNFSVALAINSKSQVVGRSDDGAGIERAFRWEAGQLLDLGSLGGVQSTATEAANGHRCAESGLNGASLHGRRRGRQAI